MLALLASGPLVSSIRPINSAHVRSAAAESTDSALRTFGRAWRNNDYALARASVTGLSDARLRSQAEQLVVFGEARTAIARGDLAGASRLALAIEPGAKRALIAAGVALRSTEPAAARRWLQLALKNAAALREQERRRLRELLLPAVLRVNPELGLQLLDRAIHESDTRGGRETEGRGQAEVRAAGSQLIEVLHGPISTEVFLLGVPGVARTDLRDLALTHHASLRCKHLRNGS